MATKRPAFHTRTGCLQNSRLQRYSTGIQRQHVEGRRMEESADHPAKSRCWRVSFFVPISVYNPDSMLTMIICRPPLFLGSSVFFAIRDALKYARKDHGVTEVLSLVSPATPERIRISTADPIIKRALVTPQDGEDSFFRVI